LVEWFTILQCEGIYFALQNEKLYKDPQENEKFFMVGSIRTTLLGGQVK
jgi:hypothetical protein